MTPQQLQQTQNHECGTHYPAHDLYIAQSFLTLRRCFVSEPKTPRQANNTTVIAARPTSARTAISYDGRGRQLKDRVRPG